MTGNRLRRCDHHLHLPAEEVRDRIAHALVRHVQQVDAGHGLEQFRGKVRGRTAAGGTIGELAGLRLGQRN